MAGGGAKGGGRNIRVLTIAAKYLYHFPSFVSLMMIDIGEYYKYMFLLKFQYCMSDLLLSQNHSANCGSQWMFKRE